MPKKHLKIISRKNILLTFGILIIITISILTTIKNHDPTFNIHEFFLCGSIDENYNCNKTNIFNIGDKVYLLSRVNTSVIKNNITLIANYKVLTNDKKLIYDVEEINPYYIYLTSKNKKESVSITDSFKIEAGFPGDYFVEITVKNPLINKTIKKINSFKVLN